MLVAAVLVAGCGKPDIAKVERAERESTLYRQAFAAEQSGDTKEAVRLYNKVLIEEPRSFSVHFQLATLLQDREEDYIGAIYHYRQYLALRPESEKNNFAQDRIRIAEQKLAPQILKKVGDTVQGITQANLLAENERLNRTITTLEGEKSVLLEEKGKSEKELASLRGDNERLRLNLRKMRVDETVQSDEATSAKNIATAAREHAPGAAIAGTDAKTLKAMREEAAALAREGSKPPPLRRPLVDVPSSESALKKIEEKLSGEPPKPEPAAAAAAQANEPGKADKSGLSEFSLFGRGEKKEPRAASDANQRTYVVQPGDTLFRVSEKFYGDPTKWKKIRDANRTRIDPDGRIRAGQIIMVP